jgi:hypothetical protein
MKILANGKRPSLFLPEMANLSNGNAAHAQWAHVTKLFTALIY